VPKKRPPVHDRCSEINKLKRPDLEGELRGKLEHLLLACRSIHVRTSWSSHQGPYVGKIEIGIYVVGAADELIRVDHFLPEDISVRYQVV